MAKAFFWCYPWDLEDEGYDRALGRLAGEIGVDAVSVAAVLDDLTEFRSRELNGPRTIVRQAAAHFHPSSKHYANTRLRPTAAAWMKSRDPLGQITKRARQHSLQCRAWAVCCRNSLLAARHPMAACVDVFGDPIAARLCPSNPDVREYVAALVDDLSSNHAIDAIELEEVGFGAGARCAPLETGVALGPIGGILKGWCFCASCRQRAEEAGLDVQEVTAAVLACLGPILRAEPSRPATFGDVLGKTPCLAAYHNMRCGAVQTLLEMVRRRTNKPLFVHVEADAFGSGIEAAALGDCCDGLVVSPKGDATTVLPEPAGRIARSCGGADRICVGTYCYPPDVCDGPTLVTRVRQAWQSGYAAIGFANYGVAPEPALDWVRQAIRFARRDA